MFQKRTAYYRSSCQIEVTYTRQKSSQSTDARRFNFLYHGAGMVRNTMSDVPVDYKTIYNKIMNLDSTIRFVTIIDSEGKLLYGGQREGLTSHLKPDYQKQSLRHAIDAWELRNRFSGSIGQGKYALAEYEKIKRITIPLGRKHLIYLTTEIEADHNSIIANILKIRDSTTS